MSKWVKRLLGRRRSEPQFLQSYLTLRDEHGDPIDPVSLRSPSEVRGAIIDAPDVHLEVRCIFGQWECLSCESECNHAEQVYEIIDEWANRGESQ